MVICPMYVFASGLLLVTYFPNEQSNVLVHTDGGACIADFGSSVLLTSLEGSTFAMSGQARGTARWAAPELFRFHDFAGNPKHAERCVFYRFVTSVLLAYLLIHWNHG